MDGGYKTAQKISDRRGFGQTLVIGKQTRPSDAFEFDSPLNTTTVKEDNSNQ